MIVLIDIDQKKRAAPRSTAYAGAGAVKARILGLYMQNKDEPNWADYVARVRDMRDEHAFAALFAHFAPKIKAFLMKSGASHSLAEECAQDVMATLWQKAALFNPEYASVSTWIYTIARNRRIDALRKDRRPEPEDLFWGPQDAPEAANTLALHQETARPTAALADLPPEQRKLIERAYYGDLSHGEIAQETGLPLGTIKSRIRLALTKLRRNLDATGMGRL